MNLGWDTIKQLLKKAWTWTGAQTFTSLIATTVDINGGTIDGTTIGASSATTGKFTTLQVTTGAVNGYVLQSNAAGLLSYADPAASANAGLYSMLNPKGGAQGVAFTYASSASSTGLQIATDDDLNMATNNFGFACMDALPDITPSADVILAQKHDGSNGWIFKVLTTGYLRLTINATSYDSTATLASIGCIDTGRMFPHFSVTRESASVAGSVVFGVNGVQLGTSVAITAGVPTTVSNTSTMYILGGSTVRYAGITSFNGLTNFAPTIAEWLEVFRLGTVPESWKWGSQTEQVTGDDSDFDTVGNWVAHGAASITGGYDSGDAGHDKCLRIEAGDTSYEAAKLLIANWTSGASIAGAKRLIVLFDYKWVNAPTVNPPVGIEDSLAGSAFSTINKDATGWTSYSSSSVITIPITDIRIYCNGAAGGAATNELLIDNVKIRVIGATALYEPEGMQPAPGQWLDSSSNKLHAMQPTTGSSLIRYKKEFEFRSTNTWSGSSATQYIGGFNQVVNSTKHCFDRIISRATTTTATSTIFYGDGSDTDYYVTAVAPRTTPLIHTIVDGHNLNDGTNLKFTITPTDASTMVIETVAHGYILE